MCYKFIDTFSDCLWIDNNSFVWSINLDKPLYRIRICPRSLKITMEYLLHKTGHCRLTLPFVQKAADKTPAEKICYSGTHTHTHTHTQSHVIFYEFFV